MTNPTTSGEERVIWEGHTDWMDHAVLFVLLSVACVRAAVSGRAGEWLTVALYVATILFFLGIAAWFHYGRRYHLTSQRVRVTSGWTGRLLQEIPLRDISDVNIRYELLNRWFDLGTLELAARRSEQWCAIRGIPHPEQVKAQLDRWIRAQRSIWAAGPDQPAPGQPAPDHAER